MATKPKKRNPTDTTLRNNRATRRDLKLLTEALKSVDKRLHLVEKHLAALIVPAEVTGTDDGVRIKFADDDGA